jgi:hypothetical protein
MKDWKMNFCHWLEHEEDGAKYSAVGFIVFYEVLYHTQYSASQELFVKFMAMGCRKGYTLENISNILRRMKVNGGDFILKSFSGGIFFQNTSPVEKMRIILY